MLLFRRVLRIQTISGSSSCPSEPGYVLNNTYKLRDYLIILDFILISGVKMNILEAHTTMCVVWILTKFWRFWFYLCRHKKRGILTIKYSPKQTTTDPRLTRKSTSTETVDTRDFLLFIRSTLLWEIISYFVLRSFSSTPNSKFDKTPTDKSCQLLNSTVFPNLYAIWYE